MASEHVVATAYVRNEMTQQERERATAHLANCAECRAAVAAAQERHSQAQIELVATSLVGFAGRMLQGSFTLLAPTLHNLPPAAPEMPAPPAPPLPRFEPLRVLQPTVLVGTRRAWRFVGRFGLVLLLTTITLLLPTPTGLSAEGHRALAVFVFTGSILALEPVSLPIAALMGSSSNAVAAEFLQQIRPWTFVDWMVYGLSAFLLIFPLTWFILLRLVPVDIDRLDVRQVRSQLEELGSMSRPERELIATMAVAVFFWVTGSFLDPRPEPFAVQDGIVDHIDIAEAFTPRTLEHVLELARPDLVLITTTTEDLGLGRAPGLDILADALKKEIARMAAVPVIEVARTGV